MPHTPNRPIVRRPTSKPAERPDPTPSTATPSADAPPSADVVRMTISLTPDGSAIDWERMRESTKHKLIDVARRDPKLQPAPSAAASAPPEIFSEAWCATIYDALGQLEASLVARIYHVTPEQAAVMVYTDDEKRILTGPTQKVLNKYAGLWLASHTDEFALVLALGMVHVTKLQQLRAAVERAADRPAVRQPTLDTTREDA